MHQRPTLPSWEHALVDSFPEVAPINMLERRAGFAMAD
jgi:hypothetical protein